MAAVTLSPVAEKFIDNCDPEDPEYQRELMRPVEIKEDVKLMEQRKRVTVILKSRKFRKELEDVLRRKWRNFDFSDSSASLLSVNYISEQLMLAALPRATTSAIGVGVSASGIIPINDMRSGGGYGRKERQLRCKLAAVHRLMDMFSWCDNNQNYVTAKIHKDQDRYLIKPFGIFFHEVTASSFITTDAKCNVLDPGSTVLSADESNWLFHCAIHQARPDLTCLIHLRSPAAISVSGCPRGLLPLSADAVLLGEVAVLRPDPGLLQLLTEEGDHSSLGVRLRSQIMQAMRGRVLLLPNHGVFVAGRSVEEVWFLLQKVQAACEVQEAVYRFDEEDLYVMNEEVQRELLRNWLELEDQSEPDQNHNEDVDAGSDKALSQSKFGCGELEFEAMMRHLDNSGYRTGYLYRNLDVYRSDHVTSASVAATGSPGKYADVEIPAVCSSLAFTGAQYEEGALSDDEGGPNMASTATRTGGRSLTRSVTADQKPWFNTPNTYKLDEAAADIEFNFSSLSPLLLATQASSGSGGSLTRTPGTTGGGKIPTARWISANEPTATAAISRAHHPVTPGAHVAITSSVTAAAVSAPATPAKSATLNSATTGRIDPRELKAKQKTLKARYYHDTNTPGPQSSLLDGMTWEEARLLREEGLSRFLGSSGGADAATMPLVTAASKGIVQRSHKDHAVVLEGVFRHANPFERMTDADLARYREEVDRKQNPQLYLKIEVATEPLQNGQSGPKEEVMVATVQQVAHAAPPSQEQDSSAADVPTRITSSTSQEVSFKSVDPGITSDSDFPGDSSMARSLTVPMDAGHTTVTSETSGTEDPNKEKGSKDKKKKKMFKNIFKKKKKESK